MQRLVLVLFTISLLTACHRGADEDLIARVEALEARYHTQARQIEELQTEVATLKSGQAPTVIDLVEKPAPQAPQ